VSCGVFCASLVREVDIKGVRKLIADGVVKGGMIPKVEVLRAVPGARV